MLYLFLYTPWLLWTLVLALAPQPRHGEPSTPPTRPPEPSLPPAQPPRQARVLPPIPDYPAFASVANRHRARWEITYAAHEDVPYRARHRVDGFFVAASDTEVLDLLLRCAQPPPRVRGYLDHSLTYLAEPDPAQPDAAQPDA